MNTNAEKNIINSLNGLYISRCLPLLLSVMMTCLIVAGCYIKVEYSVHGIVDIQRKKEWTKTLCHKRYSLENCCKHSSIVDVEKK